MYSCEANGDTATTQTVVQAGSDVLVDARCVKVVKARQRAQLLALLKVAHADYAICGLLLRRGCGCG